MELSVVIAILSVVATLGLELAANFANRTATSLSRSRLKAVDDALDAYFQITGRLPCPAPLSYPLSHFGASRDYGLENCAGSILINGGGYGNGVYAGGVPFRTLNLPISYSIDGFMDKLNYVVTVNLTNAGTGAGQFAGSGGTAAQNGTAGIEVRTGVLEQPCDSSRCDVVADPSVNSGAAYFLFSNGADQRGAYTMNGVGPIVACLQYSPETRPDSANCLLGASHAGLDVPTVPINVFYDNRYNPGLNLYSYFDDVAVWRTKAQL